MKNKLERQLTIRKVLLNGSVRSQEELLQKLKSKGFNLTQATLSRDLKNLQVARIPDPAAGYKYVIPGPVPAKVRITDNRANSLADGFLGIDFSGNLGVIKTLPGYASSIASVIDNATPWEILGTIAGDDTILIIVREGVSKRDILNSLILIMPNLKNKLG